MIPCWIFFPICCFLHCAASGSFFSTAYVLLFCTELQLFLDHFSNFSNFKQLGRRKHWHNLPYLQNYGINGRYVYYLFSTKKVRCTRWRVGETDIYVNEEGAVRHKWLICQDPEHPNASWNPTLKCDWYSENLHLPIKPIFLQHLFLLVHASGLSCATTSNQNLQNVSPNFPSPNKILSCHLPIKTLKAPVPKYEYTKVSLKGRAKLILSL